MSRSARILQFASIALSIFVIVIAFFTLAQFDGQDQIQQYVNQTLAARPTGQPIHTATPLPRVQAVIAVQDISRGMVISPDVIATSYYPLDSLPYNTITEPYDIIGQIARTDIFRGQPILASLVVPDVSQLGSIGSDFAAVLPPGRVSTTLYLPPEEIAEGLQVGDRVDVILTMPDPRPDASSEIMAIRTVQNAQVLYIGYAPADGVLFRGGIAVAYTPTPAPFGSGNTQTSQPTPLPVARHNQERIPITLAVSAQDSVTLVWARRSEIPITLVMVSARSVSQIPTNGVTLDFILQEYGY